MHPHSMTSSARATSEAGSSIPRAFAVFRLTANFEFRRLLHRKIGRLFAVQNASKRRRRTVAFRARFGLEDELLHRCIDVVLASPLSASTGTNRYEQDKLPEKYLMDYAQQANRVAAPGRTRVCPRHAEASRLASPTVRRLGFSIGMTLPAAGCVRISLTVRQPCKKLGPLRGPNRTP